MGTLVRVGLSDDVAIQGDVIEIKFEKVDGRQLLTINGEVVEDWDIVDYSSWFYDPIIKSTTPGLYRISVVMEIPGSPLWERSQTFLQRRLSFANDFPEYSEEPEGPVEVQNSFSWSDGAVLDGANWSVRNNENGERKFGSGNEILAVWEPEERVLAKTEEDSRFEKVPFTVKASATSYNILGSPFPYEISSDFDLAGQVRLRIIDVKVEPEPPFEEPDSSVTLTARAVTIATDLDPSSLEWKVDLKDADGAVVIEDLATGTGPDILAEWDGTVEDPTSYLFAIEVWGCEGGVVVGAKRLPGSVRGQVVGDSGECLQAEKEVALGTPPIVITLKTPAGEVLARSGTSRQNQQVGLGRVNDLDSVVVEASEVPEEVQSLSLRIFSRPSEKERGLLLRRNGSVLRGTFDPRELSEEQGSNANTVLATVDWSTGLEPLGDTELVIRRLYGQTSGGYGPVSGGRVFLGGDPQFVARHSRDIGHSVSEGGIAEVQFSMINQMELQGQAKEALEAGGFDLLQIEVRDPEVRSKSRVLARFANAGNTLVLSGHGSYESWTISGSDNVILASRTGPKPANVFSSTHWSNIKTLIISGCVSANLNDYALNSRRHLPGVGDDFFEKIPRSSPARTLKGLIHPNGKILGYQAAAPESPNDQVPLHRFFAKLDRTGAWSLTDPAVPRLWIEAHAEVDFLDSAAAMDSNAFYFIKFEESVGPVRKTIRGKRQTIYHKERWLGKIARADWDKPLRVDHDFIRINKLPNVSFEVAVP